MKEIGVTHFSHHVSKYLVTDTSIKWIHGLIIVYLYPVNARKIQKSLLYILILVGIVSVLPIVKGDTINLRF